MQIDQIQKLFSLPENSARIFSALLEAGEVSPRHLAARLSMNRPSVYDHLERLQAQGLINEREVNGRTKVSPIDPIALDRKLNDLQTGQKLAAESLLAFANTTQNGSEQADARIKFHEGTTALQTALHDILWYTKCEVTALWPYESMRKTLGDDFLQSFNEKRVKQKVGMKVLWTEPQNKKKHLWQDNDTGIERRVHPTMKVDMSYTIYEQNVLFISSQKESFGFTITSKDFSELMKSQFEVLWNQGKKQ
jgi:sugar-specific transcriptional regulator TrmB